jgi:glycosyltransferase involved in cell wall biosynthesis
MTTQIDAERSHAAEVTAGAKRLDDIRVLVLFGGSELFGQERANLEVFRALSEEGLKARFVTSSKWGADAIQPELRANGFEWTSAPFGYQWGKFLIGREFYLLFANLWGLLATSWRVWREMRTWRPTHIYSPNWAYWLYAAPAITLTDNALVFRAGDQLPAHTAFHRWTGRKLLRRVACVICNSRFLENKFARLGVPARKLRVIYNRPPQRTTLSHETIPEVSPGTVVVVFVGQISKHKGAPLLVEAAKKILSAGENAAFWLVGESAWENTLAEQLKRDVADGGFEDRIRFLGYRRNIPEILCAAHIHVCPSISEDASPNVIMEAKKEGVPSVAFSVGGIPELVEHRVDGYICHEKTVEALVEGMRYFMGDSARRTAAGQAARRSLEEKFGDRRFDRAWVEVFLSTAERLKIK